MNEVAKLLRQYEGNLSSSLQACVSAVEKLSEEVHQLKENLSSPPPERTSVHQLKENALEKLSEKIHQLEERLSSPSPERTSVHQLKENTLEKLSEEIHQLKESLFSSPPVQTRVSAIRGKRSSMQGRQYGGHTHRATLWFYLRDHGEAMRKWDGKSTATLEARVRELQRKTIGKKEFSERFAAPTSSRQSFKHRNEDSDQD